MPKQLNKNIAQNKVNKGSKNIKKPSASASRKQAKKQVLDQNVYSDSQPHWDSQMLQVGDIFSNTCFLQVVGIKNKGNDIIVRNHLSGKFWEVSKLLMVRDMESADHFDQEI